jgi:hypothetical protein
VLLAAAFVCVPLVAGGCAPEVVNSTSTSAGSVTPALTATSATTGTSVAVSTTRPQEPETTTTTGPKVIKIGALVPLSGDLAPERQGAPLSLTNEVPEQEGVSATTGLE